MSRFAWTILCAVGLTLSLNSNIALSLSPAGTLTCTTDDAKAARAADIVLSCSFQMLSGRVADFSGYAVRRGDADFPAGKRVLVWSVLARDNEISVDVLAGKYRGATGGEKPGRLIGGKDGSIVLQRITATSQIAGNEAPTVLELRLDPLRA